MRRHSTSSDAGQNRALLERSAHPFLVALPLSGQKLLDPPSLVRTEEHLGGEQLGANPAPLAATAVDDGVAMKTTA